MGRCRRALIWAGIAALILVASGLALYYANDWWLSGVMTVSIVAWLAGVLAAIYGRPERRGVVIGAVLASFLYVLFALGPWFRVNVGPWLLTSQALVHVETKWLGRQTAGQQILAVSGMPTGYILNNITGQLTMPQSTVTSLALVNAATPVQQGNFFALGHWLFAWLAAGVGAIAAGWMQRRRGGPRAAADGEDKP